MSLNFEELPLSYIAVRNKAILCKSLNAGVGGQSLIHRTSRIDVHGEEGVKVR